MERDNHKVRSQEIVSLVALRYKLLWAQTRTRNGRIALFLASYIFALFVLVLFTLGGFGAGMLAVRSGRSQSVAQAVLGGLFLNGVIASVVTGFGINSAFTDAALRRFPLSPTQRLAARHVIGIAEPTWVLILGLYLGVSTAMYVYGAGSFWLGALAVLLLVIANYLLARVLATLIEWLSKVRGGTAILAILLITIAMLPGILAPRLANSRGFLQATVRALRFTPPFAAAALVTNPDTAGLLANLALLAAWIVALIVALAAIERQAVRPRSVAAAAVVWDSQYDRAAALFGPDLAPLVARSLRYYLRSNRVRINYFAAIPPVAFLIFHRISSGDPAVYFIRALGIFTIAGFVGTAVMSTNQFGFDGSGFRRYFLLPAPPRAILRAGSYTALMLGGILVTVALLLWFLLAPVRFDWRMVPLLLASGYGGLLLFNGLSLWTSLLAPRRTDFETTFGNQLSLPANVLLIGGILVPVFGTYILSEKTGIYGAVLSYWWISVPALLFAAAIYLVSLERGSAIFLARKEELLNILEGRI